jgi:hypothetical protein
LLALQFTSQNLRRKIAMQQKGFMKNKLQKRQRELEIQAYLISTTSTGLL